MFSFSDWFSICTKCTKVPKRKSQVTITSTSSSVTKQANRKSPVNNPQYLKCTCTEIKQDTLALTALEVLTVAHILSCLELRCTRTFSQQPVTTTARCDTSRLRVNISGLECQRVWEMSGSRWSGACDFKGWKVKTFSWWEWWAKVAIEPEYAVVFTVVLGTPNSKQNRTWNQPITEQRESR